MLRPDTEPAKTSAQNKGIPSCHHSIGQVQICCMPSEFNSIMEQTDEALTYALYTTRKTVKRGLQNQPQERKI